MLKFSCAGPHRAYFMEQKEIDENRTKKRLKTKIREVVVVWVMWLVQLNRPHNYLQPPMGMMILWPPYL